MRQKYMLINFYNGVNSMLLTNKYIRFNNILIRIPNETKRIWDISENRWGFRFHSKIY